MISYVAATDWTLGSLWTGIRLHPGLQTHLVEDVAVVAVQLENFVLVFELAVANDARLHLLRLGRQTFELLRLQCVDCTRKNGGCLREAGAGGPSLVAWLGKIEAREEAEDKGSDEAHQPVEEYQGVAYHDKHEDAPPELLTYLVCLTTINARLIENLKCCPYNDACENKTVETDAAKSRHIRCCYRIIAEIRSGADKYVTNHEEYVVDAKSTAGPIEIFVAFLGLLTRVNEN